MSLPPGTVPAGTPPIPHNELPVYIESLQRGDHHHFDHSDTSAEERRPIAPQECWIDIAQIPSVPPAIATPFVAPITGQLLTQVPGNPYRYSAAPPGIAGVIPANYGNGAYAPTLRDSLGANIPYNPGVWVADGVRGVVEFKVHTPQQLGLTPPLFLSYWQYLGALPVGPPAPPASVALYVDDSGNDTTGNGSLAAPFATLPRAFEALASTGWDVSAEVRVVSTVTLPAATHLNAGSLGLQANPPVIVGSARGVVRADTVTSATRDAVSNLVLLTTVGGFTGADVGRVVRFTSGPLAAYTPSQDGGYPSVPAPPPFPLEVYVSAPAAFGGGRLAYADVAMPGPGDTIEIIENLCRLRVPAAGDNNSAVISSATPLMLRDLDVVSAPGPAGVKGLGFSDCQTMLVGVRYMFSAGDISILATVEGGLRTGSTPLNWVAPTAAPTVLGIFVGGATSFTVEPDVDGSPIGIANSAFTAFALVTGAFKLLSCDFVNGGQIYATQGRAPAQWVRMTGTGGPAVLGTQNEGGLALNAVHILFSQGAAVDATTGAVEMNEVLVEGSAAGLSASAGGSLLGDGPVTVVGGGPSQRAITLSGGGTASFPTAPVLSGTFADAGVSVDAGSLSFGGDVTAAGAGTSPAFRLTKGARVTGSNFDATSSGGAAVVVDGGSLLVGGTLAAHGAAGAVVSNGGSLDLQALIASSLTDPAGAGLSLEAASATIALITATGNAGAGVVAVESSLAAPDGISATANLSGVSLTASTLTAGDLTLDGQASFGLSATASTFTAGALSATGCGSAGPASCLALANGCRGALASATVSSPDAGSAGVIDLEDSTLVVGAVSSPTSASSGLVLRGAELHAAAVDVSAPPVDPPAPVPCASLVSSTMLATGLTTGFAALGANGVQMSGGSRLCVTGTVLATFNSGAQFSATEGSVLVLNGLDPATSVLSLEGATGAGIDCDSSTLIASGLRITGGAAEGILLSGGEGTLTGLEIDANATGVRARRGATARLDGILSTAGPNATFGLAVETAACVTQAQNNTVTGLTSDAVIGANAPTSWATLNAGASADVSDFAAAFPQLCRCVPT